MKGKVCFLAGGTGGLGLAIARAFADREAVVIVGSSSPERLAAAAELLGDEHCLPIDVTDQESIRDAFERTVERYARLDVVINAAGIIARVPTLDMELVAWERLLRVNVTGTFLTSRAAARIMREQEPRPNGERGCLLHFASIAPSQASPTSRPTGPRRRPW